MPIILSLSLTQSHFSLVVLQAASIKHRLSFYVFISSFTNGFRQSFQGTFSTTATVPHPSIAEVRCIRRLRMCANRKFSMSEQFEQSGPSYTPYHMMVETRPLYLLIRLIRPPLRLRRRYPADPLPTGTSNVVYIYVPFANYTVASSFFDLDQPTHYTI